MTIIEALQFCKATGRSVCRSKTHHVRWDLNAVYSFTADALLADDWEDAEPYTGGAVTSGRPSLDPVDRTMKIRALPREAPSLLFVRHLGIFSAACSA